MLLSTEELEEAFEKLIKGEESLRSLEAKLHIPKSTLHRYYTSWVEKKIEEERRVLLGIKEEIAALQSEREKIKEELARYEPLKREVRELESQYNRLKGEIREALELREQRDKLRAEVESLRRRRDTLTAQVSELNRMYEELLWLLRGWESYRIWLQSEIERLSYEVSRLKGEKEDLQSSVLALTAYKKQLA